MLACQYSYCQRTAAKRTEQFIGTAIKKAYPACVRMWGYDTVANQRTGGQFSGVVVSKDGRILTAAHVTAPGNTYKVMFADGKECIARALGKIEFAEDKTRPDAGMMQITSKGSWPYAEMGNSAALKTFEPCISIAYPESLNQPKPTVRFGYVTDLKNERGFIKSTCLMEPGDSGGPLFDLAGRLIGLHSAIEIPEAANYDVPVDTYKKYWNALSIATIYYVAPDSTAVVNNITSIEEIAPVPALKDMSAFAAVSSKLSRSCLRITSTLNGTITKASGTLFSLKGLNLKPGIGRAVIISKSSLIGDEPVLIEGDKKIKAKVISRDKSDDLVLLLPLGDINGGLIFKDLYQDTLPPIHPGLFLISPQPDTLSTVSISGSTLFSLPKVINAGFLGAFVAAKDTPVSVIWVKPASPALMNDIRAKDEVISINGNPISKPGFYGAELQRYWPGDTLVIKLKRAGQNLIKTIVLGNVPQIHFNHPAELFAGGKSDRRDGFKCIFAHDAILKPYQCGGPVFDLEGHFYGINIARYSRVACVSMPAANLFAFIGQAVLAK